MSSYKRVILEMGMGVDLYGEDYTKAAKRGISDALRHSSLTLLRTLELDRNAMRVTVTVGVQKPDRIDSAVLQKEIPYGEVHVNAELGGMNVVDEDNGTTTVMASVAVIAELLLPDERFVVSDSSA
ncbi:MAG: Lin0512 family protein [Gammaproteobacteria bacterium]|nr:Lin0512 family protein [Gammaproteobacteria bacterium]